jgi:hypothetical protein
MELYNFPMCKSWIFWDEKKAYEWAEQAEYPVVFKLKGGAGSQNVILVDNKKTAKKLIRKMFGEGIVNLGPSFSGSIMRREFNILKNSKLLLWKIKRKLEGAPVETVYQINKNYVFFQEFLPDNKYDTRVTIIGNRAFAFRRFTRKNDFRSSGSGIIDHDPGKIDLRCIEIAFEISAKMNFQSMAYDFLYNKNHEPEFSEISYSFVDRAVYECNGYWDRDFKWHEGHYWPQFCQLQDLLNRPDLKQPEII